MLVVMKVRTPELLFSFLQPETLKDGQKWGLTMPLDIR